jgi:hypothetical protein
MFLLGRVYLYYPRLKKLYCKLDGLRPSRSVEWRLFYSPRLIEKELRLSPPLEPTDLSVLRIYMRMRAYSGLLLPRSVTNLIYDSLYPSLQARIERTHKGILPLSRSRATGRARPLPSGSTIAPFRGRYAMFSFLRVSA